MENKITHNVLEQIKSGQVKMHSRTYFVFWAVFSAASIVLTAFLAWFFFSLMLFALERHNALYLPLFGVRGFWVFLLSFPWLVFGIGVVLFILLDKLLNNYSAAYRRPALYTVLGVFGVLILCLGFVRAIGINNRIHEFVAAEKFPGLSKLYELSEGGLKRSILLGRIEELTEDGFILITGEGERAVLQTTPDTRYSNGSDLKKGETVIVGSQKNGERYSVYGVRKVKRPIVKAIINKKIEKNTK